MEDLHSSMYTMIQLNLETWPEMTFTGYPNGEPVTLRARGRPCRFREGGEESRVVAMIFAEEVKMEENIEMETNRSHEVITLLEVMFNSICYFSCLRVLAQVHACQLVCVCP